MTLENVVTIFDRVRNHQKQRAQQLERANSRCTVASCKNAKHNGLQICVEHLRMLQSSRKAQLPPGVTWIYFIQASTGGPVKIGRSRTPKIRLQEIQKWHPSKLHIVAMFLGSDHMELDLHKALAAYRDRGEWFHPCGLVAEVVKAVRAGEFDRLILDDRKEVVDVSKAG